MVEQFENTENFREKINISYNANIHANTLVYLHCFFSLEIQVQVVGTLHKTVWLSKWPDMLKPCKVILIVNGENAIVLWALKFFVKTLKILCVDYKYVGKQSSKINI